MKTRLLILGLCVAVLPVGKLMAQEAAAVQSFFYSTSHPEDALLPKNDVAFVIKEINIQGNKRTRRSTVLREAAFRSGEAYPLPEIIEKLEDTKRQLMNTNLFRNVEVTLRSLQDLNVFVNITVEEKWYFY